MRAESTLEVHWKYTVSKKDQHLCISLNLSLQHTTMKENGLEISTVEMHVGDFKVATMRDELIY